MNKKENQQFSDDRELQNRFTAYVQKAMENTRSTYYSKKMTLQEHETVYDEANDTYKSLSFKDILSINIHVRE